MAEVEVVLSWMSVDDDGPFEPVGVVVTVLLGLTVSGLNGEVVCIGDGEGSGVFVALLGRVPGVCSATRGV